MAWNLSCWSWSIPGGRISSCTTLAAGWACKNSRYWRARMGLVVPGSSSTSPRLVWWSLYLTISLRVGLVSLIAVKRSTLGIERVAIGLRRPQLIETTSCTHSSAGSCLASHPWPAVVSGFHWSVKWPTLVAVVEIIVIWQIGISCTACIGARRYRRLTNLHSRRKGVFQEYSTSTTVLISLNWRATHSWIRSLHSTWRHWVVLACSWAIRSLWTLVSSKVMTWNPLTVRMLLSSSCSWIEKVIDALECSTLPWYFTVFVHGVLQLNIWKSGEHLFASVDALANLFDSTWTSRPMSWAWAFIQALSLHYLSMCWRLWRDWVLMSLSTATRRKREHILMMIARIVSWITIVSPLAVWDAVCSISSVLRRLYHRWQLQLLIVWVVTFLSVIPFPIAHHLLVELNTSLRRWGIRRDPSWTWVLRSDTCVQRGICAGHQIDVVETSTDHVPGVAGLVISQIELVEMVRAMHNRVTSVVSGRMLILLHWMKVVITTASAAELPMTVASLRSVLIELICWAWHPSTYVIMMWSQRNLRCSWIAGASMSITGVCRMCSAELIVQRWSSRWTSQCLVVRTMSTRHTAQV